MTPTTPSACPRCLGPVALFDGDVGAVSRATPVRRVTICGICGQDESVREAYGLARVPPEEWPVPASSLTVWPTGG